MILIKEYLMSCMEVTGKGVSCFHPMGSQSMEWPFRGCSMFINDVIIFRGYLGPSPPPRHHSSKSTKMKKKKNKVWKEMTGSGCISFYPMGGQACSQFIETPLQALSVFPSSLWKLWWKSAVKTGAVKLILLKLSFIKQGTLVLPPQEESSLCVSLNLDN